jgi:hypothetical protein
MPLSLLADLVVLLHVAFVLFVVFGGLLALKWPRAAWLHLPAAAWGAAAEFGGWICPLTYLEGWLLGAGASASDQPDFLGRYLLPLLYPTGLTRSIQLWLGLGVMAINLAIYGYAWRTRTHPDSTTC